jgi:hypothetical protein
MSNLSDMLRNLSAKTVGISHGFSNRVQNVNQTVEGDSSSDLDNETALRNSFQDIRFIIRRAARNRINYF